MRTLSLLLLVSCFQSVAQFGPAVLVQADMNVAPSYDHGGYGTSFRIEDVDGDGAMDVIHIVWPTSIVWIRNSDGFGTFIPQDPIWNSASHQILYDLADMDLDGDLDAVVYERTEQQHSLHRIENLGNGSFGTPVQISDGGGMDLPITIYDKAVGQLVCRDVSGDGYPEVLYTVSGGLRWFLNDGTGNFSVVQAFDHGETDHLGGVLRVNDIDNDGDQDIITDADLTPGPSGGELYAALNTGVSFDPITLYSPYNSLVENIQIIDIDEDGDLDLLDVGWYVQWFENPLQETGFGAFEYHWIEPGENEGSGSIGKIGCNDHYSLIYGRWPWQFNNWNLRWTHFNDQLGDFTPPTFNETPKARYYRLADLNSDGHLDLVTHMNDTTRWYPYDANYLTSLLDLQLPFDTIALNDGPQPLIGGAPDDGYYSIAGSQDTLTLFDPIIAGVGEHQIVYSYTDPFTGCSGSDTAIVVVELSTEILQRDQANGVAIFPNPAQDHCTITYCGGTADLQLIDATGRIVQQWLAVASPFQMDLSPFLPGIYLIQTGSREHRIKVKLVLQ